MNNNVEGKVVDRRQLFVPVNDNYFSLSTTFTAFIF